MKPPACSLEGTDFVSKRISSDVGFECIAQGEVHLLRNEFLNLSYDSRIVEQVNPSLLVEV